MPIRFIAPAKSVILSSEEGLLAIAWGLSHGLYVAGLVSSSTLQQGGLDINVDLGLGELLTGAGSFGAVISYTLIALHLLLRFWRKAAEIKKIEEEVENIRLTNEALQKDLDEGGK